jgi:hypothetical protein
VREVKPRASTDFKEATIWGQRAERGGAQASEKQAFERAHRKVVVRREPIVN